MLFAISQNRYFFAILRICFAKKDIIEEEATVELNNNGNLGKFTFPVKKQKTGWKVIVGQDSY